MDREEIKKIAIVYCRVSSEAQAENGISLDVQEKICREYAEHEGYAVLEAIRDEGKSGGNLNRPGIKRLIELIEQKAITAVIMIHGDRLARNTSDHIQMMDYFEKNGVAILFVHQPGINRSTAAGYTMDTVLAVFAEHHRRIIKEKTGSAIDEKVSEGWLPGVAPIGYLNKPNPLHKKGEMSKNIIVPDPERAPFITESFREFSTGNYNGLELCEIMRARGFRTRRNQPINPTVFYAMLSNPLYVGEVHWGGRIIKEGKHTPLIDRPTFERVQILLKEHAHYGTRRRTHDFLLRGIVRCNEHRDRRYTAEFHKRRDGSKFSYYHCTNRGGCKGSYISSDTLEHDVPVLFKELNFSQGFIDRVVAKVQATFDARRLAYERQHKSLDSQRAKLFAKRTIAENKLFEGTIADEDFTRIRKGIEEELKEIDKELADLSQGREAQLDVVEETLKLIRNIYGAYRKAGPALKRVYLRLFFKDIYVCQGVVKEVIWNDLVTALLRLKELERRKRTEDMDPGIISDLLGA